MKLLSYTLHKNQLKMDQSLRHQTTKLLEENIRNNFLNIEIQARILFGKAEKYHENQIPNFLV